jgi:hypothetical protein
MMWRIGLISIIFSAAVAGAAYGQQQQTPTLPTTCCGGSTTCTQASANCRSGCTGDHPSGCIGNCQRMLTDCMASGIWTSGMTGKQFSLRRE